jgi:hypothetical protein
MALIVKSRRRAASRIDSAGSPVTVNPLCPRPVFDSRRGSDTSTVATLYTVKLSPTVFTAAIRARSVLRRSASMPNTSTSMSFDG